MYTHEAAYHFFKLFFFTAIQINQQLLDDKVRIFKILIKFLSCSFAVLLGLHLMKWAMKFEN